MHSTRSVVGVSACAVLASLAVACNKTPSGSDAPAASAAAAAPAAPLAASAAPEATPLSGFDPCLVGTWKGNGFSMNTEQVTAEGGANLSLKIDANGASVVDFGPMAPINGKGAGANFDFQYSGKASGTLSTPTRGTIASTSTDYSSLRVTTNVSLPGAGKLALFKNKPVSELAQMVAGAVPGKAPAAAPPPGIDSSPIFSNSRYTCAGDTLTLSGDKIAAHWSFARVSH